MSSSKDTCLAPSTGAAPQIFATALHFFTALQCSVRQDWPKEAAVKELPKYVWKLVRNHDVFLHRLASDNCLYVLDYEIFDFIIVGAGTAGCVVANRLSENKELKILLIEAGGDPPAESIIPNLNNPVIESEIYSWHYKTVDNGRTNQANENNSVNWPRGKMLGGSGGLNGMAYIKGKTQDYQNWYDEGNKEWHPSIVWKYFKKAENIQDQRFLSNPFISENYGHHGPQVINTFNSTFKELNDRVLDSWNEIGFKNVADISSDPMGSGIFRVSASDGERRSTATTYLNPIKERNNLKILKNTLVTKILIDDSNKTAYGVEVERNGHKMTFSVTREIIISAGTINTPQLLMLSGIGPKEHLDSLNISCKVNLSMVGKNLQDHLSVPVTIYGNKPGYANEREEHFEEIKYLYNRTGYLAQVGIADIVAFYSSKKNATYPDYQNHLMLFPRNSSKVISYLTNFVAYKQPAFGSVRDQNVDHALYLFLFNILHPLSRGSIVLQSSDPKAYPLIDANYFGDPRDLKSAIIGIKMLTKIVNTQYFKSIDGHLGRLSWPTCDNFVLDSDEYWKCICINMVNTVYHPIGTAKMGPNPDTSVVDSRLRVHGVKGLRLIDASVMPSLTSGNTNGPVIMIGERASDLIKEDFGIH